MPSGRLDRLAAGLALAVRATPTEQTTAGSATGTVAVLFEGLDAVRPAALWERPFAAWIDVTGRDDAAVTAVLARAAAVDAFASVSTSAASDLDLAQRLVGVIGRYAALAEPRRSDIEFALHEALSNAVLHGNLQMDGMKGLSLAELERFSHNLAERLGDPVLAGRRVEATIQMRDGMAFVEIGDEGDGFTRATVMDGTTAGGDDACRASGRGLDLIAAIAATIELLDGGRRIRLGFPL